jgi:hypothetical protein
LTSINGHPAFCGPLDSNHATWLNDETAKYSGCGAAQPPIDRRHLRGRRAAAVSPGRWPDSGVGAA